MSKQLGIKEVLNLTFYDFVTGKALLSADYATDTSIDSKATRLDLTGGQGNYKLMSFDHSKIMTFKSTLPLCDLVMLSQLAGKPLTTGKALVLPKKEILIADATNKITLSEATTLVTGSLQINLLEDERDLGEEQILGEVTAPNTYSIAAGVVTLNATTAPLGTRFVVFYNYTSPTTASQVTFTANNFPGLTI